MVYRDVALSDRLSLSATMEENDHISPALNGSRVNCTPVVSCQPLHQPGMTRMPPVEQRIVQQNVERLRGGCCCPGGSVWVCSTGVKEDEEAERAQLAQQMRESKAAQSLPPPTILPALKPSSPRGSEETVQSKSLEQSKPVRRPTNSLPTSSQRLELPQTPQSRPGQRRTAATLPHQPAPSGLPHQRPGRRMPAQSLPPGSRPNLR